MGSSWVSSREVTWGPAGSFREPVPSMPQLTHRLPTCSSDGRAKGRRDLGSGSPAQLQAAHLSPGLLIFLSCTNGFAILKFAAQEGQVALVI